MLASLGLRFFFKRLQIRRIHIGSKPYSTSATNTLVIHTPEIGLGGANIAAIELAKELNLREWKAIISGRKGLTSALVSEPGLGRIFYSTTVPINFNNIILNTLNQSDKDILEVLRKVRTSPTLKLAWWVHEDEPGFWINSHLANEIGRHLDEHPSRFRMFTPSVGTASKLTSFFNLKEGTIKILKYPLPDSVIESSSEVGNFDKSSYCIRNFCESKKCEDRET